MSLVPALVLTLSLAPAQPYQTEVQEVAPDNGVAREFAVRRLAADPVDVHLDASDWRARSAVLEALGRSFVGMEYARTHLVEELRVATVDPHPNVREAALELAARAGRVDVVDRARRAELAADPFPAARRAYLNWLASAWPAGAGAELLALARKGEPGARSALLGAGEKAWPFQHTWFEGEGNLARDFPELLLGGVAPELVFALREEAPRRVWVELLAAHAGVAPDLASLMAAPASILHRREYGEAARRSGLRSPELGRELARGLLQRADLLARDEGRLDELDDLVGAAIDAVEGDVALELLVSRPDEVVAEGLRVLKDRVPGPDPRLLAGFLAESYGSDVRGHALDLLASDLDGTSSRERAEVAGRAMVLALGDRDFGAGVFRDLASAEDPRPFLGNLHRTWLDLDPAGRMQRLRDLPRQVPCVPFEADLVEALGEGRLEPSAIELCAPFPAARPVLVRSALDAVARLASDPGDGVEQRLRSTLAALGRTTGDGVVEDLARIAMDLVELGEPHAQFAKYAMAALAMHEEGELLSWMAVGMPQRVRLEAALGSCKRGTDLGPASRVLVEGYSNCDRLLRMRALTALAAVDDRESLAFLRRQAGEGAEHEERRLALEALAARGDDRFLGEWARAEQPFELVLAWIDALVGRAAGGSDAAADALRQGASVPETAGPEAFELLDGELAIARARLGLVDIESSLAPIRALAGTSESLLRERQLDLPVADVAFRFDEELRIVEVLARRGEGAAVLSALEPLERLDGRLALALARMFEGEARLELARRGWIALQGEPEGDDSGAVRVEALMLLLQASSEVSRYDLYAEVCTRLLGEGARDLERRLGTVDVRRGVDPRARLRAGHLQALAWDAFERGERASARALAARAASRTGFSRRAREAQERLTSALSN